MVARVLTALAWVLLSLSYHGHATALTSTDQQSETLRALIEKLEDSHYVDRRYNDAMSREHLNSYLERLDPSHLYFTARDIADFDRLATVLDDQGRKGNVTASFEIFNRYEAIAAARLDEVIDTMDVRVGGFDFEVDEFIASDPTERDWAVSTAELDDRWRKRIKNQVLGLRLADKAPDDIASTLRKRYENQRLRLSQYNAQDVFAVYANALTSQFGPHTSYFSPRRAENFDIDMKLSLEGIGAVLQNEDEYVKVVRVVPAGPADKQSNLKAAELIVAVGQGDEGPMVDVIGWRLDDVVDLVRGKKGTVVRLDVIPASGRSDELRRLAIVRNEVRLEEQAEQMYAQQNPNAAQQDLSQDLQFQALVAQMEAQGTQQLRDLGMQVAGAQQGEQQQPDPLIALKQQELQIKQSQVQGDLQKDQAELAMDQQRMQNKASEFQQRLASQERMTDAKIDAAREREILRQRGKQ